MNSGSVHRRLCRTFQAVSALPAMSATFTHKLEPHWPLCPFELRGACHDSTCEFQMARDYNAGPRPALQDLLDAAAR